MSLDSSLIRFSLQQDDIRASRRDFLRRLDGKMAERLLIHPR